MTICVCTQHNVQMLLACNYSHIVLRIIDSSLIVTLIKTILECTLSNCKWGNQAQLILSVVLWQCTVHAGVTGNAIQGYTNLRQLTPPVIPLSCLPMVSIPVLNWAVPNSADGDPSYAYLGSPKVFRSLFVGTVTHTSQPQKQNIGNKMVLCVKPHPQPHPLNHRSSSLPKGRSVRK